MSLKRETNQYVIMQTFLISHRLSIPINIAQKKGTLHIEKVITITIFLIFYKIYHISNFCTTPTTFIIEITNLPSRLKS